MHDVFNLENKKGLILGLANDRSIAWGCTRMFRSLGAEVIATCLNDKARQYVKPLTDAVGIELLNCDVELAGQTESVVAHAVEKLGQIDFLIHSIAWAPLEDLHNEVTQSSRDGFSRSMAVSCHSFAEVAKLCAPHMPNGGSMLAMTYLGAGEVVPHYGLMGPVKAALESMVRYMAMELGPKNIRIHAVSPGPILTRAASGIEKFDQIMAINQAKAPLKRLVTLDEIAQLCAFLCMDAASGMSGQTIYVDAGVHAMD